MAIKSVSVADDAVMTVLTDLPESRQDASAPVREGHGGAQASTLGVQMAGQSWLVDMADIGGVLPLPPLTPVPLARPWFMGLVNVRGRLYGVTDLAAFQQKGKASGTAANRILLVAERYAFNTALLVDCVLGLRDARVWEQVRVEEQIQYRDEQGNVWFRLDVAELLGRPDFLQTGI